MKAEDVMLKLISREIELKYNCEVVSISLVQNLSPCVRVKIKFYDDFIYRPFDDLPKPETIVFSERSVVFTKRVDLFECVREIAKLN